MQSTSLQQRKNQIASTYGAGTAFEKSQDSDIMKGGEGTKGGKVIGHTRSGKPIYGDKSAKHYHDFTSEDHQDAADTHLNSSARSFLSGKGGDLDSNAAARSHKQYAKDAVGARAKEEESETKKKGTADAAKVRHSESRQKDKAAKDFLKTKTDKEIVDAYNSLGMKGAKAKTISDTGINDSSYFRGQVSRQMGMK